MDQVSSHKVSVLVIHGVPLVFTECNGGWGCKKSDANTEWPRVLDLEDADAGRCWEDGHPYLPQQAHRAVRRERYTSRTQSYWALERTVWEIEELQIAIMIGDSNVQLTTVLHLLSSVQESGKSLQPLKHSTGLQ